MILVDTNVIIDVAAEDPVWCDWSTRQLEAHRAAGLAINPMVYAELSVHYDSVEALEQALAGLAFARLDLPWEAAFVAGKAYRRYRAKGGVKRSPLPDFYIGAHAAVAGLQLLTRDSARYREYFRRIALIAPE